MSIFQALPLPTVLVVVVVILVIWGLFRPVPTQIASNGGTIHNETKLYFRVPL